MRDKPSVGQATIRTYPEDEQLITLLLSRFKTMPRSYLIRAALRYGLKQCEQDPLLVFEPYQAQGQKAGQ